MAIKYQEFGQKEWSTWFVLWTTHKYFRSWEIPKALCLIKCTIWCLFQVIKFQFPWPIAINWNSCWFYSRMEQLCLIIWGSMTVNRLFMIIIQAIKLNICTRNYPRSRGLKYLLMLELKLSFGNWGKIGFMCWPLIRFWEFMRLSWRNTESKGSKWSPLYAVRTAKKTSDQSQECLFLCWIHKICFLWQTKTISAK